MWQLVYRMFLVRAGPGIRRQRGRFPQLVVTCVLFVLWRRRCLAEARRQPVQTLRLLLWSFLSERLEAEGEQLFLRRWHTRSL